MWDCGRKVFDFIDKIDYALKGLREYRGLYKKFRNAYRNTSEIHRKIGSNYKERLKISCQNYLQSAGVLIEKLKVAKPDLIAFAALDIKNWILFEQLKHYQKLLEKHTSLVRRRILEGETIPHSEKMFSIFETYTEWLNKGKQGGLVELGLNVNLATCQNGFILCHQVMQQQVDVNMTIPTSTKIAAIYTAAEGYSLDQISFDKNYFSGLAKTAVQKDFAQVIMPKKGKKNEAEKVEESAADFKLARRKHSAVESNINALEQHGLDRCPDRSIAHFKRYVALGVLSYNITLLGKLLL